MKEKMLVLAKAIPEISKKFEHTVCVAGITDHGEWRRIYPIPWHVFWSTARTRFAKKSWIEYETELDEPSDHRPESRKILFDTIKPLSPASYQDIEDLMSERITTIEQIEEKGTTNASLGVIKPYDVQDFIPTTNDHYEDMVSRKAQVDIFGHPVIKLDIPKYKFRYKFKDDKDGRMHENLCEDWEVGELYRNCEEYRREGKYKNEAEVHEKVKKKMLVDIFRYGHVFFIIGSHYRFNTYMIVGVLYPRKADFN